MREIEFRVFVRDKKKIFNVKTIDFAYKLLTFEEENKPTDTMRVLDQVELMQYTGLKDKNGKKIYEGDIIKYKINETLNGKPIYIYYCINYCETENCLRAFKNGLTGYAYQISFASYIIKEKDLEVVGNIYEHPEFLTHQHEEKGE